MFIQVRLLKGFPEPLWYQVPAEWQQHDLLGAIVRVPIRNRTTAAVVEKITLERPQVPFAIKAAYSCEPFPSDPYYRDFIEHIAQYYQTPAHYLIQRLRQFLLQKETDKTIHLQENVVSIPTPVQLTEEQQKVSDFLLPKITEGIYAPTLMHGVTGSGKTEVYKTLIHHTLIKEHKTVVLLLPEVSLAVRFTALLRQQLQNDMRIVGFHSAVSVKEKRVLWQGLMKEEPMLIIGVHLPMLLPISNLGLIIVDEEHDVGYQEKKHPKINSKDAGIWRAQKAKIPILLGSATPSISSLYNVKTRNWHFFQLTKRFAGAFPQVKIVSLQQQKKRKSFWITPELEAALKDRLAKREQSIIFLNRRGYSFFVQCKQCSFIFNCEACSVSLTLHDDYHLMCHYCGISKIQPPCCPQCKADQKDFLKKGIGTQQVVSILSSLFPQARIGRMDLDTTINKKRSQNTMEEFQHGSIDILVGTQTITKGYHIPNVTLVGVLWADLNLHFPIFNAAETCLQQLIQVAGRAGRATHDSLVIIQTMIDHPIFDYLNEVDYVKFYERELENRTLVGYPPALRLAEIELKNTDEQMVDQESEFIVQSLDKLVDARGYEIQVLGPAKPPVYKIKNIHVRKIYLKGANMHHMITLFDAIKKSRFSSSLFFTPNPLT